MITVYDSTSAQDIHDAFPNAAGVAGYCAGTFEWTAADWALFPNAFKLRITPSADVLDADVLDVETGDVAPTDETAIVNWTRNSTGLRIVYCGLANWQLLKSYFPSTPPLWWVAHYTGVPTIPTGAWGIQYANQPLTGYHLDTSVIEGIPTMTDPNATQLPREGLDGAPETGNTSVDNMAQYEDANFTLDKAETDKDTVALASQLSSIDTQLTALTAALAALTAKVNGLGGNLTFTVTGTLQGVADANA